MNKYKIGIAGHLGCVGSAVKSGFERLGHQVVGHDPRAGTKLSCLLDTDAIFICVPTPADKATGHCNTNIVEGVVEELASFKYKGVVAIKSTVKPGTTNKLQQKFEELELCFVPEFLRERSAFSDFIENHNVCIIGVPEESLKMYGSQKKNIVLGKQKLIAEMHGHYPKQFKYLTSTEAELAKYFHNVFNALRVVWANNFYDICDKMGADYTSIKNACAANNTFQDIYMDCNENFRGFCGVCLPKDSSALAALASDLEVPGKLFQTIVEDNKLWRADIIGDMRRE